MLLYKVLRRRHYCCTLPIPPLTSSQTLSLSLCSQQLLLPESHCFTLTALSLSHTKMASPKEPTTPPPVIGKIGPYTVFLTPPSPTAVEPQPSPIPQIPKKVAVHTPPPVKPPPVQFDKPPVDRFGIFRDAVTKVQNVHATVDEFMANWLGLNQSKFQWALDDYYEAKGVEKGDAVKKESNRSQTV